MILNKHIPALSALLLCVCLVFCGLFVYAASASDAAYIPEYQKRLFGDEILTIDIQVAEESWQSLKGNAMAKEWICGDLVVNGQRFSSVGIRAKGNSSLMQVGRQENGRYSLQFKFNRFVKGQTCYGLDAFCINNMLGDATYMKDYLSYDIMKYIGVASPLANYANVTVNGEAYGFFVALERYEKAFLGRAFGTSSGQLYNVKIQMGMRQNFEDMFQDGLAGLPNWELGEFPDRQRGEFPDRQRGGMGGFPGRESGGGSLIYTGEDPERYSSIFNNAVFNRNSDKDKQRVITAIENLNAGTDLEKYFDVDAILRYFAAHTMVVNLDSYVSNMQQNYYIYERDGKLSILPWDYGLAFGGFQSGSASSVVNFPIDTPVSGVAMESRPLLSKLFEVSEYLEKYHEYLHQIAEGYFNSGLFEERIKELDVKINQYVKNDVSAFFTHEQYEAALPHLANLGRLRAESVKGQLNGTVPATTAGQDADSSSLVDAGAVDLAALGSMMGGMRPGGEGGGFGRPGGEGGGFGRPGGGMEGIDMDLMRQAMQILMDAGGELTDEVRIALIDLGFTEEQVAMFEEMQNRRPGGGGFNRTPLPNNW